MNYTELWGVIAFTAIAYAIVLRIQFNKYRRRYHG